MDIKEVRWDVDFIQLAVRIVRRRTLVNTVLHFRVPKRSVVSGPSERKRFLKKDADQWS
jgi:hypothetical protein